MKMKAFGKEWPAGTSSRRHNVIVKDFLSNRYVYLMLLPVLAFYLIFHYAPMYGLIIAFKDYSIGNGILHSKWVGFGNFESFFNSIYFWRLIRNTLLINLYSLVLGFPVPIILAILFNEIRNRTFKKLVQTASYLPHFVSIMVLCGMIIDFTATDGLFNDIVEGLGGQGVNLLTRPEFFRAIYVSTGIWKDMGWGSIIFIAAIVNIDHHLYEASNIDGAGKLRQLIHITLPGIMPTIVILLILRIGQMMSIGYEKIILLYNPSIYETADVISSFVYRQGLLNYDYSYGAAVGLFNSVINFLLLLSANYISRKVNDTSLW